MEIKNKVKRNPRITILHHDGQYLVINPNKKTWLRTNSSGKNIIDSCDGTKTADDILQDNARRYSISAELIKESIHDFISQCISKGMLFEISNGEQEESLGESSSQEEAIYIEEVYIELTTECQLDCLYCPFRKSLNIAKKTMSQTDFAELVRKISLCNPTNIILTGGEPLLREDILDICRITKESGHRTTLFTNLAIGDEELFKLLIKYVDRIWVSLDGSDETVHDQIRGQGSFGEVISRLKILKSLGFEEIGFCHTPNKLNFKSSVEMVDFALRFKINELIINRLFPLNSNINGEIILTDEQFAVLYEQLVQKYREGMTQQMDKSVTRGVAIDFLLLKATGIDNSKVFFDGFHGHSCGLGVSKISIDVEGNFYPCRFLHYPEFKIGNVFVENFHQVYQNSLNRFLPQKNQSLQECSDCYLDWFCNKGCRASRFFIGEEINQKDILCKTIYKDLQRVLWGSNLLQY